MLRDTAELPLQAFIRDADYQGDANPLHAQPLHEGFFQRARNRHYWVKPDYGLWTSSYLGGDRISGWAQWCEANEFGGPNWRVYLAAPVADALILDITCRNDLREALEEYECPRPEGWPDVLRDRWLDYEKLAQDNIIGVHVTQAGERDTRFGNPALYGFDCESTVWLEWPFAAIEYLGVLTYGVMDVPALDGKG